MGIPEEVVGECVVCVCDFGSNIVSSGEMIQDGTLEVMYVRSRVKGSLCEEAKALRSQRGR